MLFERDLGILTSKFLISSMVSNFIVTLFSNRLTLPLKIMWLVLHLGLHGWFLEHLALLHSPISEIMLVILQELDGIVAKLMVNVRNTKASQDLEILNKD